MRGRIAFINPVTRTGMIYGADRNRYMFALANWTGSGLPPRNQEVSFQPSAMEAVQVGPFTGNEADQEIFAPDEPAPVPVAPRRKPVVAPVSVDAFRQAEEGFGNAAGDEVVEDEPHGSAPAGELESGEAFPDLEPEAAPRPQMGKLLFTQSDAPSSRMPWKLYLICMTILVLLTVVCWLVIRSR